MKRLYVTLLVLSLLIGIYPSKQAEASGQKPKTEPITIENLEQATKEYEFNFPADATTVLYQSGTYSYSGDGTIYTFTPDHSTRKIKVVIQGKKQSGTIDVKGFSTSDRPFTSTPGNAFCRYSDGIDWQAATYNLNDGQLGQKRYSSSKPVTKNAPIPPTDIPYGTVRDITTFVKPTINIAAATWLDSNEEVIPLSQIDYSSVELKKEDIKPLLGSPAFIRNQTYHSKNPTIGTQYTPTQLDLNRLRDVPTSNPAFLTGHAICKMYPVDINYTLTAKANLTGYSYGGTLTYQYITTNEPAMIGQLIADPNSVKFDDKDIKVMVTLIAEVINIPDARVLQDYRIYLRTDDSSVVAPMIKITANGQKTVTGSYEFTIPKSAMTGKEELTQLFKGRALVDFKVGELYKGELDTGLLSASTYVYKKAPHVDEPSDPKPQLQRPVAIIQGDSEVKLGDYADFHGLDSYDPDGTITEYRWSMPGGRGATLDEWDPNGESATAWYDNLGPQRVILYVKDNDGLQGSTYHSLVVTEPTIDAGIRQTGTLKENRKVTFIENSDTPEKYPSIEEKITWKIESEKGDLDHQIKYEGSLNGKKSIDVLFKQSGNYKVTISVENTAGYKSTATKIVNIKPDEEPYANFDFQKKIYRDPIKGNIATFTLKDRSYSFDGDTIVRRNWYVIFDANNDEVFNESRVLISAGNETEVSYETTYVGNYRFLLEIQEEFGQPTIDAFVTANDRRKSNTWQ